MADLVEGIKESLNNYLSTCPKTDGWKIFFYPRRPTMGFSKDVPAIYVGNPTMNVRPASLGYGMVDATVRFPIHMYSTSDSERELMTSILREFSKQISWMGCVTSASFEYTSIMSVTDRGKYHSRASLTVRVIAPDPGFYCDPESLSCAG